MIGKTENYVSLTEARKKIFELAQQVQNPGQYIILTEKGEPKAVMFSFSEMESVFETLEIAKTAKLKDFQQAGQLYTAASLLEAEGYVLAEKPKKKYGKRN